MTYIYTNLIYLLIRAVDAFPDVTLGCKPNTAS